MSNIQIHTFALLSIRLHHVIWTILQEARQQPTLIWAENKRNHDKNTMQQAYLTRGSTSWRCALIARWTDLCIVLSKFVSTTAFAIQKAACRCSQLGLSAMFSTCRIRYFPIAPLWNSENESPVDTTSQRNYYYCTEAYSLFVHQ